MMNLIVDEVLKQFLCKLTLIICIFALALVWFYCDGQDELRAMRGQVYGDVRVLGMVR